MLHEAGHELILVSSGHAGWFGALSLRSVRLRLLINELAAVGQGFVGRYDQSSLAVNITKSTIGDGFVDQRRYKNAHRLFFFFCQFYLTWH